MSTTDRLQLNGWQANPPSTSTVPFVRRVAAWSPRAVFRLPVTAKTPRLGSYNSALARMLPAMSLPPAIRTVPPFNSVAVPRTRPTFKLPVTLNELVAGSYSSALDNSPPLGALLTPQPPLIRTVPSISAVAVAKPRAVFRRPVATNVPVDGIYRSALDRGFPLLSKPPAISTVPSFSRVAVRSPRAVVKFPVTLNNPVAGS